MMALLVSAQVSAQFPELSRGSAKLLSEIFPVILGAQPAKASAMHDKLATHTNGSFDAELLSRFQVLREMRNSVIHRSGLANQRLVDAIGVMTPAGEEEWRKHADRSPRGIQVGDLVTLVLGELIVALATKALAGEASRPLVAAVLPPLGQR